MINNFMEKAENIAQKKIFCKTDTNIVDSFINKIENAENTKKIPDILKDFLLNCSVKNFYEIENDNILIRFSNMEDIFNDYTNKFFLKKGFFIFADNSDCDIYFTDISVNGNSEVYLGSRDLFDNEFEIVFYKKGIIKIPFNYENIKKMSIKLADSFSEFINSFICGKNMTYDVVKFVINRYNI